MQSFRERFKLVIVHELLYDAVALIQIKVCVSSPRVSAGAKRRSLHTSGNRRATTVLRDV